MAAVQSAIVQRRKTPTTTHKVLDMEYKTFLPGNFEQRAKMHNHKLLLFGFLLTSSTIYAGEQIVTVLPSTTSAAVAESVQVGVNYTTASPQDSTLTGIGVRLHWNASLLEYQQLASFLAADLVAQGEPEPDSADFDSDPNTDTFIHLAWADIDNSWPNLGNTPMSLFSAEFSGASGATGNTPLNISMSSTAAGYSFVGNSSTMSVDCTGSHIEISVRTFVTGEDITCNSSGDIIFGPYVEQQDSSAVHLTASTGISISGPLSIKNGASFNANQGGL